MNAHIVALALGIVLASSAGAQVVENVDTAETFATLQAAIDDADTLDGHTLQIMVGAHSTPELQVLIDKSLTFLPASGGTTLSPTLDTGTSGDARGWFLIPQGETVTFRGLFFDGSPARVHTAIRNHGTLTVANCEFTEIKFDESGPSYAGIAISHFDSAGAPMSVSDCKFSEIGRIGIHVFEPATIVRTVYEGKGVGDWLDYFSCVDSFGASIGIATFDACRVSGNRGVASSDGSGSAGILITDFFGPGTDVTLLNCAFTDSSVGVAVGFNAAEGSDVRIRNCTITGNDFGLVGTSAGTKVDAVDNWWGDASGPADASGTFEAMPPLDCFAASFTPAMDVVNADGAGNSVTDGNVDYCPWLTAAPLAFDQDVIPDAIFGSGNANGSWTADRQDCVELAMRAKLRFPPSNIFKSNGDGSYTFNTGSGTGSFPDPEWAFEWSVNTDYDGGSGWTVGDLTYEIGMDFDPGVGQDNLVFDPISIGTVIPYTTPTPPIPFWDHSMGDNSTPNGGGLEAADPVTYANYLATFNVAQNSWRSTFFDEPPFAFDPDIPGRYDFYLAAFDGGAEVARTSITVYAMDGMSLTLEGDPCQPDQDSVRSGVQVIYELWLRNPDDLDVTGYQAFLSFDDIAMNYVGSRSLYTAAPFETHVQPVATAQVGVGELRLDGSTFGPGVTEDALLARLVFTINECDTNAIGFDLGQPFASEASFGGVPYATSLVDSPAVLGDATAPVIAPLADITQPADAGSCTEAVVVFGDPIVADNCDPAPVVVCSPPSGSTFPVGTTTVTCTATDACGNASVSQFDVTITPTNLIDVVVELTGSMSTSRCITFVTDSCAAFTDVDLNFVGANPAVATATIEVPCGVWTQLCAKDEQHTLWADTALGVVGSKYVAATTLILDGGDTDDDGDIDINDVTFFVAEFGNFASPGGCPWDGVTRDADFNNNGVVGSEDYPFLSAGWLDITSCGCLAPSTSGRLARSRRPAVSLPVRDAVTQAADLDGNGRVDVADVELLERFAGLSGELSRKMRRSMR